MIWRVRHWREFFWEPVMKRLHRVRQLRVERDYYAEECGKAEAALVKLRQLLPEFGPMDGRVWRIIDDVVGPR